MAPQLITAILVSDVDKTELSLSGLSNLEDFAICVKDESCAECSDHAWSKFDINDACQITIKDKTGVTDGLIFKVYVKAKDRGKPKVNGAHVFLYSPTRVVYIRPKSGITKPQLNINFILEINEMKIGEVTDQTGQLSNILIWNACKDASVPDRGVSVAESTDKCTTTEGSTCLPSSSNKLGADACNLVENCYYADSAECLCRDQNLKFEIVRDGTFPESFGAVFEPFAIDQNTGALSVIKELDYESLDILDDKYECELGYLMKEYEFAGGSPQKLR